jgi:ABC-2 type transport system permease protein
MKKALLIGWKDLRLVSRDRAALMLILAAPFLLTLGMGLVTGRFSGSSNSGLQEIPVVIVNQDDGQLGEALLDVFRSPDLEALLAVEVSADEAAARDRLAADEVAAVVIIPTGFTDSIIPAEGGSVTAEVVQINLVSNPARPVSAGVVQSVVESFLNQVETGLVGGQVAVTQLLSSGLVSPDELAALGQEIGTAAAVQGSPAIALERADAGAEDEADDNEIDTLSFLAPGLAVMFLMYTVSYGGRSLLAERDAWTLSRLLTTPTKVSQVLGGKVSGIYLTGLAQLLILIGGTSLLFQLNWGNPLAVLVLIMATVFGAAGWGILLASLARTPNQVLNVGTALMLLFGILGGSFFPTAMAAPWMQALRMLTPNAWALDGLSELALGGDITDILPNVAALLIMGSVLFVLAVIMFRRRRVLSYG